MKRARFSEEQIISILNEAEAGAKVTGAVPASRDLGQLRASEAGTGFVGWPPGCGLFFSVNCCSAH